MLIMPSFKKSLIVEQFQGNYLKLRRLVFSEEEQTTFFVALDDVQAAILSCDLRTPEHPVV